MKEKNGSFPKPGPYQGGAVGHGLHGRQGSREVSTASKDGVRSLDTFPTLSPHPRKISDSLVSEGLTQLQAQTGDRGKDRA